MIRILTSFARHHGVTVLTGAFAVMTLSATWANVAIATPHSPDQMSEVVPVAIGTIRDLHQGTQVRQASVVSFRSPTCGCCKGWVEHMRAEGFTVDDQIVEDISAKKTELGIPGELAACHTAVVDGYLVEGHIPAEAIAQLLDEKPEVKGIAVPGMPIGTPGMEFGDERESFSVYSFTEDGQTEVFRDYL
ncbi:MAG: DUF411 domain-containing protein [Cyanobacteria bacterium J06639_1]